MKLLDYFTAIFQRSQEIIQKSDNHYGTIASNSQSLKSLCISFLELDRGICLWSSDNILPI